MNITRLLNQLSAARMEYESLSHSVLNRFVVPFKIDELDLRNQRLSMALVGSRGSGKSTYIQYFSHSTRFDNNLDFVAESELECIILYWKPDIAYCQGLNDSWLGNDTSLRFFKMHSSIELIDEFSRMLKNVQYHFPKELKRLDDENSNIQRAIKKISNNEISTISEIEQWVDGQRFDLSTRLNPINLDGMLSLEPKSTLEYLISSLVRDCGIFKQTHFKVFVDEFELLNSDQQKLINSYRKESKSRLNWNVAYKLYAKVTTDTSSNQPLQEPDDFRTQVLDDLIKTGFDLYAAEIFLLSIKISGLTYNNISIGSDILGDRNKIIDRQKPEYRESVLSAIRALFPTPSPRELSNSLAESSWLRKRIEDIVKYEKNSSEMVDKILENPSLAVVIAGTFRQKNFNIKSCLDGISQDKINTYEFSSLLTFRNQNSNLKLPLYSGFERFVTMTTPNVRHFKELCFSSLKLLDEKSKIETIISFEDIPSVSPEKMDAAAVSTSKLLADEVISYPPYGNKLYMLVNRIGELFKISQKSNYQTEPERVIFSIKYDYANSDTELEAILNTAECWKVLISDDSKRLKSENQLTTKEYMLNPMYSPKFGISYRKKRGIIFEIDEFRSLINGTYDDFEIIKNKYRKIWKYELESNANDDSMIKDQGKLL